MTDGLDAAIRARLAEIDDSMGRTGSLWGAEEMQAALLAVLDRHKPVPFSHPLNPNLADCSTCRDLGPGINEPAMYPCEEIEDIARALGVEMANG